MWSRLSLTESSNSHVLLTPLSNPFFVKGCQELSLAPFPFYKGISKVLSENSRSNQFFSQRKYAILSCKNVDVIAFLSFFRSVKCNFKSFICRCVSMKMGNLTCNCIEKSIHFSRLLNIRFDEFFTLYGASSVYQSITVLEHFTLGNKFKSSHSHASLVLVVNSNSSQGQTILNN